MNIELTKEDMKILSNPNKQFLFAQYIYNKASHNWQKRVSNGIKRSLKPSFISKKNGSSASFVYLLVKHNEPDLIKIGGTSIPRKRAYSYEDLINCTLYLIDENSGLNFDLETTHHRFFREYNNGPDRFYVEGKFYKFAKDRIRVAVKNGWYITIQNSKIIYPKNKERIIPYETRKCICGCNEIFECKINSGRRHSGIGHHRRGCNYRNRKGEE